MTVYELLRKYDHIIETDLNEAQNMLYDGVELDWVTLITVSAYAQIELMFDVIDCISNECAKNEWKKRFNFLREYYEEVNEELIEELKKEMRNRI